MFSLASHLFGRIGLGEATLQMVVIHSQQDDAPLITLQQQPEALRCGWCRTSPRHSDRGGSG